MATFAMKPLLFSVGPAPIHDVANLRWSLNKIYFKTQFILNPHKTLHLDFFYALFAVPLFSPFPSQLHIKIFKISD